MVHLKFFLDWSQIVCLLCPKTKRNRTKTSITLHILFDFSEHIAPIMPARYALSLLYAQFGIIRFCHLRILCLSKFCLAYYACIIIFTFCTRLVYSKANETEIWIDRRVLQLTWLTWLQEINYHAVVVFRLFLVLLLLLFHVWK